LHARFTLTKGTPKARAISPCDASPLAISWLVKNRNDLKSSAGWWNTGRCPLNLEIAVGRLREAQEAELQADCGIPSGTFSVLRADDASRIKPASCVYRPEPTAISRLKYQTTPSRSGKASSLVIAVLLLGKIGS
jgi:hypothetical protein